MEGGREKVKSEKVGGLLRSCVEMWVLENEELRERVKELEEELEDVKVERDNERVRREELEEEVEELVGGLRVMGEMVEELVGWREDVKKWKGGEEVLLL